MQGTLQKIVQNPRRKEANLAQKRLECLWVVACLTMTTKQMKIQKKSTRQMFDNDYKANEDPKEVNKTETKESNNNEESKNGFMFVGIVRKLLWRKHYLRFVPLLPQMKTGWLTLEQWHT
jgi:hypothetical protein